MLTKAITIGILGIFSLSWSTCGKSNPDDATSKEKPADKPTGSDVVIEGIDTSMLTPREKKEWGTYVSEFLSPCQNVPVPIAQCVQEKRACSKCLPAAKFVLRGVKDGMNREQIEKAYKNRFDADKIKDVPIDGSPVKGPDSAPITIVEFADFECPVCAVVAPRIDELVEQRRNEVRLVYKFYPLSMHAHADIAARAAIAAWKQGKFWEMHHALYANAKSLEQTDLDLYAKELGLDISRFHADMQSKETTDRIARDKKLGDDVNIGGTPTFFINGRLFDAKPTKPEMNDWISLELSMMNGSADGSAHANPRAGEAGVKK
ncbi:MAG: thioredoxin domain-containing protein [Polyangiaceae bacterium]|nr:thioredoxin domain-containing protein [Polyangiaceae bacterium]